MTHLAEAGQAEPEPTLPMIPLHFIPDGITLQYFSLVTTVGTPQSIAAQELRIECMFPDDDQTEEPHRDLMDGFR